MMQPETSNFKKDDSPKNLMSPMTRAQWTMNVLLVLAVFIVFFLSGVLPVWAGYENSSVEWVETIFLFIGFLVALFFSLRQPKTSFSPLWLSTVPFWLMFCGRELSWGAAFLPPTRMGSHGPVLLHLRQLPYGSIVYPILAVLLGISFYIFFKERLPKKLFQLFRQRYFPIFPLAITFLAAIIANSSERHLFVIGSDRNQILEELMEFVCYVGLFITQIQLYIRTKNK